MIHFSKIEDFVGHTSKAFLSGSMYRTKFGFPLLVKGGGDVIQGHVHEVRGPGLLLRLLDEFFGVNTLDPIKSLHVRETVLVEDESGQAASAQVFFLNPLKLPPLAVRIENGDWQSSLQKDPPLSQQLSEPQRLYIQRMGATGGRETVPLDMNLYRELLQMKLIEDVGRQLNLSKLGQEVYRFLA